MRNALQRARALLFGLALVAAFIPAGRADAAQACGYVRVQATTVPLLTLCNAGDCGGPFVLIPLGNAEVLACVTE